jgi:hypothetical protein
MDSSVLVGSVTVAMLVWFKVQGSKFKVVGFQRFSSPQSAEPETLNLEP